MKAYIQAVAYHLPDQVVTNEDLARQYPEWSVQKIAAKTGILQRHIARENECASDLAHAAALKLFAGGAVLPADVDFILLCTQSPDYFLPTTACLLQDRLGIPKSAGALDFNLGCSGYIYGLSLAKGLVETGQARRVLLLTAETYSKFIGADDKSARTIFGDAAAATLVAAREGDEADAIGPFVFGTDGSGGGNLIVGAGGARKPGDGGNPLPHLYMNGPAIFNFTLSVVPSTVDQLLRRADLALEDIDLFVFHQANQYMLEHLKTKVHVPDEKFFLHLAGCGNTVSSTIPIALVEAQKAGRLAKGGRVMLLGFGVGYSWGGAMIRWG